MRISEPRAMDFFVLNKTKKRITLSLNLSLFSDLDLILFSTLGVP